MLRFFKEKHIWIIPVYTVFYLVSFYWLEQRDINQFHLIHTPLDDVIPFLPIFIIPYLLWFGYIAAVVAYFALFNKNVKEYWQLMATLGVGMTVFLIISWLYPNMQQLRPVLDGTNGFWTGLVANLYAVDTNTNIFPSIHVFNSIAVCIAIFECKRNKNRLFCVKCFDCLIYHVFKTAFPCRCYLCNVAEWIMLYLVQYFFLAETIHASKRVFAK